MQPLKRQSDFFRWEVGSVSSESLYVSRNEVSHFTPADDPIQPVPASWHPVLQSATVRGVFFDHLDGGGVGMPGQTRFTDYQNLDEHFLWQLPVNPVFYASAFALEGDTSPCLPALDHGEISGLRINFEEAGLLRFKYRTTPDAQTFTFSRVYRAGYPAPQTNGTWQEAFFRWMAKATTPSFSPLSG